MLNGAVQLTFVRADKSGIQIRDTDPAPKQWICKCCAMLSTHSVGAYQVFGALN